MGALVPAAPTTILPASTMDDQARAYVEAATAPNTRRAYRADWRHFEAWCASYGVLTLPASTETVARYLIDLADTKKVATIQRRLTSIARAHQTAGLPDPTKGEAVHQMMRGIRRTKGTAPAQKAPVLLDDLRAMVATLEGTPIGRRDRALLLIGFAGAFRRSELVALDVADLAFGAEGLTIAVARSKTDQEGAGEKRGIPFGRHADTCPVAALTAWLATAGIAEGALFRPIDRHGNLSARRLSGEGVAIVVKRCATAAGLDPARYAGHSLRAGLATAAAAAGVQERDIARQTGHRSMAILRRYIRDGDLFRANAAGMVGL